MKSFYVCMVVFAVFALSISSCKNDKKEVVNTETQAAVQNVLLNDTKALEGSGAKDVSEFFKLNQTQMLPEGNVAFHFKSQSSMDLYIYSYSDKEKIDFNTQEVVAVFCPKVGMETAFKVNKITFDSGLPFIDVDTIMNNKGLMNDVKPSFVVTIPKNRIAQTPAVSLNGQPLALTSM